MRGEQIKSAAVILMCAAAGYIFGMSLDTRPFWTAVLAAGIPAGHELFDVFTEWTITREARGPFRIIGTVAFLPFYGAVGAVCLAPVLACKMYRILSRPRMEDDKKDQEN